MPHASNPDAVVAARRRFFDEGFLPEGLLDAPILRSWQRCASRGLETGHLPLIEPPNASELRELKERHERLWQLVKPEMDALRADARLTDSVVILTDASGLVLDLVGDSAFAGRASQVALRPGVPWNEGVTGTNAIGTALFERRPIVVHGAEHFFEHHNILACAAAPLIDPRGALAGALDMSGHPRSATFTPSGLSGLPPNRSSTAFLSKAMNTAQYCVSTATPRWWGRRARGSWFFAMESLLLPIAGDCGS